MILYSFYVILPGRLYNLIIWRSNSIYYYVDSESIYMYLMTQRVAQLGCFELPNTYPFPTIGLRVRNHEDSRRRCHWLCLERRIGE